MVQTLEFDVPELLRRLKAGQIPMSAKVRITFEEFSPSLPNAASDGDLSLFKRWEREEADVSVQDQAENDRIYAEIERNGIPRVQI